MKKILLCAAFIAASFTGIAQVGVGTNSPDKSAILELASTTKGFLPPRMSTTERNDINNPVAGLVIYNTTIPCVQFFNGYLWFDTCSQTLDGPSNSNLTVANPTYQGASVIDATGIGYNGEAVPAASTITVELINGVATTQGYSLSATDDGTGLIYAASGTIGASATIFVKLTPNAVVMPALESGLLTMPLLGTFSTNIDLKPRIDVKSIPASATQATDVVHNENDDNEQTWMDRNLGARRKATAINDVFSYGNYYQWGRPADGHEIMVWNGTTKIDGRGLADVTPTLADDAYPSHANFITSNSTPYDWLDTPAGSGVATLWATANQGPCPANYHVPTREEWNDAITPTWTNSAGTYNSILKLPSSGAHYKDVGEFDRVGQMGVYWTNAVWELGTRYHYFAASASSTTNHSGPRATGYNVRCIKN
jgi:uncharacterized protein (TIGR02145 family)